MKRNIQTLVTHWRLEARIGCRCGGGSTWQTNNFFKLLHVAALVPSQIFCFIKKSDPCELLVAALWSSQAGLTPQVFMCDSDFVAYDFVVCLHLLLKMTYIWYQHLHLPKNCPRVDMMWLPTWKKETSRCRNCGRTQHFTHNSCRRRQNHKAFLKVCSIFLVWGLVGMSTLAH